MDAVQEEASNLSLVAKIADLAVRDDTEGQRYRQGRVVANLCDAV